ncbi:uncharacterized protein snsl isoform X2 [Tenebrio molitor]|jgi:hypothetical protein|uniref:uncharacterized protein snsl isoform X2 n=1 Tax=Tenebrio molitor TaxID=7067 RepID=UPI003624759A
MLKCQFHGENRILYLTDEREVAHSLIVPDEIPTILSVIYSNIPVLKKGTDSRIGWGFRLGDRADFQVMVELGPQKYTQPLGNQGGGGDNNRKRNTADTFSDTLYAQRQKDKQISDTDGGRWLEAWSKSVRQKKPQAAQLPSGAKPGLALGEIDAKSVIPDDSTLKLTELYKEKRAKATTEESESEVETTTVKKE